jgi:hypothetical protein
VYADLAHWWATLRMERAIWVVESAKHYHRENMYFHAERANQAHLTLVRLQRESELLRRKAHRPSLCLVDGSRR